ncbi:MAG: hypothetical protein ACPG4N_04390 [Gammaproteobacteria bacterium]
MGEQSEEPANHGLRAPGSNNLDITGGVRVDAMHPVAEAVFALLKQAYPTHGFAALEQAFEDFDRLFHGRYHGYRACETLYHDVQHTLDMTLAMARICVSHDLNTAEFEHFGPERIEVGLITALFHDSGYIRSVHDSRHENGAEYTKVHVSRSAEFLEDYLPGVGEAKVAGIAGKIVHFTGYEVALDTIHVDDARYLRIGHALGSADLMAQMADRCYLEKCRDRLYPEFVIGGIAQMPGADGGVLYSSPMDLIRKTPAFAQGECKRRLNGQFGSIHEHVRGLFGGEHPYMNSIHSHVDHAQRIAESGRDDVLRRNPPETQGLAGFPDLRRYLPDHAGEAFDGPNPYL